MGGECTSDQSASCEVRARARAGQHVIGERVLVGHHFSRDDLVTIELTTGLQVTERASVPSGVTGTNFQRTPVSEHEMHDVMTGDWRFSNADEGDRHDRSVIYGVHKVADSELRNRTLTEGRRNRRVGRRTNRAQVRLIPLPHAVGTDGDRVLACTRRASHARRVAGRPGVGDD